MFCLT